jgi:hypothetical protein
MQILILAGSNGLAGVSLETWLTIAAVLLSPFFAVFAQRQIDRLREKKAAKVLIFHNLMITRNANLSPRHVEALNAVPLSFTGPGKEKQVLEGWQEYLDHLGTDSKVNANAWLEKRSELMVELLHRMSRCLGYKIEKLRIKKEGYLPQLFLDVEQEQTALRRQLIDLTDGTGKKKLAVALFEQKFSDIKPP